MRKRLDFVCIVWRDAEASGEWASDPDTPAPRVWSGGWVLRRPSRAEPYWVLCADFGEDALDPEADKNRQMKVPRGMIESVERVGHFDGRTVWWHTPEPLTPSGAPVRRPSRCDPSPISSAASS